MLAEEKGQERKGKGKKIREEKRSELKGRGKKEEVVSRREGTRKEKERR